VPAEVVPVHNLPQLWRRNANLVHELLPRLAIGSSNTHRRCGDVLRPVEAKRVTFSTYRSRRLRTGAGATTPSLRRRLCRLFRDPPSRQRRPGLLHHPGRRRSRHGDLVRVLRHRAFATYAASASARSKARARPRLTTNSKGHGGLGLYGSAGSSLSLSSPGGVSPMPQPWSGRGVKAPTRISAASCSARGWSPRITSARC
jgi:hypothetical protein